MSDTSDPVRRRNVRVAIVCAVVFFGMVGAAFAAVPFYRAFCQLTGFDGTVRKADAAPDRVLAKTVTVHFDVNVRNLPWTFKAGQNSQDVKIGETKLAYFKITNNSDHPITGRAVFNVVPELAGQYVQKLQCFCFSDQTLQPHQTLEAPVLYFIDPEYADDFETRGQKNVTLSYTFYPSVNGTAQTQAAATPSKPVG
jgi:cytochrome c oxidase assembly protein subunit 11